MPTTKRNRKNPNGVTNKVTQSVKSIPGMVREQPGKAAAAAAGLAAAAAASVFAARKIRGDGAGAELHVRAADGEGWVLTRGILRASPSSASSRSEPPSRPAGRWRRTAAPARC